MTLDNRNDCPDCGATLRHERDGDSCLSCGYCEPCLPCSICGRKHVSFEHVAPDGSFCFRTGAIVGVNRPRPIETAALILHPLPSAVTTDDDWIVAVVGGRQCTIKAKLIKDRAVLLIVPTH
jgi:hypothetical protein